MKVKLARTTVDGLILNEPTKLLLATKYRGGDVPEHQRYTYGNIGEELTVYGMSFKLGICEYFFNDRRVGYLTRYPALFYDIVDDRMSRYWHMKYYTQQSEIRPKFGAGYPVTWIMFKEWIEEESFWQNYLDSKPRELAIALERIAQMDAEFLE